MNNVLLVIAPGYDAPNAFAYAVERARQSNGSLVVLAVLDPEAHAHLADALTDRGWVGERVSEDVVGALERDHRAHAQAQVEQLCDEARQAGLSCEARVEVGDPGEVCRQVVAERGVSLAVVVVERRSWVTRFLSRSAPVKLPALPGCELKVMEN
jgi:nucleotide-binding universal stress UspA family protein